ncbi:hypothetical protein JCM11957_03810 [Caminibacter profundus]
MYKINNIIKNDNFILYYQPKINLHTQKIEGAEALIRIKIGNRIIFPNEFIPHAEKSGEIIDIDRWVMKKIIEDSRNIFTKTNQAINISFNVSAKHFLIDDFEENLTNIFTSTKDFNSKFQIEITESAIINNTNLAIKKMHNLKNAGFSLSLDDFGTGYSSLKYFKDFPIYNIKIDKYFIDHLNDKKSLAIVEAIIFLSKKLNISTTAEGIEEIYQVDKLKEIGCDEIQGYYYSKPLPIKKFITFVKAVNKPTNSQFIIWSDEKYGVGDYSIDTDHMILTNILNNVYNILTNKEERKKENLNRFIEILDDYIHKHFEKEFNFMKKYNYPYIKDHVNQHKKLLKNFNEFKKSLTSSNERNLHNLFNIVKNWLIKHEITKDKKMVEIIKKAK